MMREITDINGKQWVCDGPEGSPWRCPNGCDHQDDLAAALCEVQWHDDQVIKYEILAAEKARELSAQLKMMKSNITPLGAAHSAELN